MNKNAMSLVNPMNLSFPPDSGGGGLVLPYLEHEPALGKNIFIAQTASVIGRVWLGNNVSIWFGAVLRGDHADVRIGTGSNVQDNAVLHADEDEPCIVGANVTVGHKVILHGCKVEDECTIGMGAIVLNKAVIGKGTVVGAGALVTKGMEIPPYSLVLGAPAKIKRQLREEEIKAHLAISSLYIETARNYIRTAEQRGLRIKPI
jgi:gamma-carbonic anhydrase